MGAGARVYFHVRVHYRESARTYERVNPSNREFPGVSALPTAGTLLRWGSAQGGGASTRSPRAADHTTASGAGSCDVNCCTSSTAPKIISTDQ